MPKKPTTHQRLSRRETLRLAGAAGAITLVGRSLAGAPCAAQNAGSLSCVVSPALTEGPYFVDEKINRSDLRYDPANNKPGVPLILNLTVHQVSGTTCTPLPGATVDIWHCDALGSYSDEAALGTAGKKFLRGYQVTDASGAVQFTTIYPGWYMGRAVHIHFKVRGVSSGKTYEFTSQFFFDDAVTDTVYTQAPYNTRGARDTRNSQDGIYMQTVNDGTGRTSGQLLLLPLTKADADYVGTFDIGLTI